eukprot:CAMPEP_0114503392 /NCGR_PEP_ID=MMETSP0109-20121206/9622_1 /TAXON_ID=29199 /ORGANISM="Chlorarachnion reptans, Strain CCCM449" /LENGTH=321 /DNA_ID=CAMNT_0001681415 /DNA_START=353 /DNA_END=1318 /DNA_ORIENTATION=+
MAASSPSPSSPKQSRTERSLAASNSSRRSFAKILILLSSIPPLNYLYGPNLEASASSPSLQERLETKSLEKSVFNRVPGEQEYPNWMEGTWKARTTFAGYEFPSRIPKEQLVRDVSIPGFQKLSVAYIPDIGSDHDYSLRYIRDPITKKIIADTPSNLKSIIDSYTSNPDSVKSVQYDRKNPNRCTIELQQEVTRNAQRIELFTNARESQLTTTKERQDPLFITSETIRQVNLGYGEYKRSKELVLDYQLVYTFTKVDAGHINATISTVGYVQPNEAMMYSGAPMAGMNSGPVRPDITRLYNAATFPVVFYSHTLTLERCD